MPPFSDGQLSIYFQNDRVGCTTGKYIEAYNELVKLSGIRHLFYNNTACVNVEVGAFLFGHFTTSEARDVMYDSLFNDRSYSATFFDVAETMPCQVTMSILSSQREPFLMGCNQHPLVCGTPPVPRPAAHDVPIGPPLPPLRPPHPGPHLGVGSSSPASPGLLTSRSTQITHPPHGSRGLLAPPIPPSPTPPPPWEQARVVTLLVRLVDAEFSAITSDPTQLSLLERDVCSALIASCKAVGCATDSIVPGSIVMNMLVLASSLSAVEAVKQSAAVLATNPRLYFTPYFETAYGVRDVIITMPNDDYIGPSMQPPPIVAASVSAPPNPPPPVVDNSSDGSDSSVGLVVGLAIAVAVATAAIVAALFMWRRGHRNRSDGDFVRTPIAHNKFAVEPVNDNHEKQWLDLGAVAMDPDTKAFPRTPTLNSNGSKQRSTLTPQGSLGWSSGVGNSSGRRNTMGSLEDGGHSMGHRVSPSQRGTNEGSVGPGAQSSGSQVRLQDKEPSRRRTVDSHISGFGQKVETLNDEALELDHMDGENSIGMRTSNGSKRHPTLAASPSSLRSNCSLGDPL
eukprot:gene2325-8619_t